MAETLTLTTPIAPPTQTTVRIDKVTLDVSRSQITIEWLWSDDTRGAAVYPTPVPPLAAHPTQPTGAVLLAALNVGDFRGSSLVKQIILRLQADGYVPPGAISGTPT